MRDPGGILAHPDVRRMLDFSEPVAVLFVSVLSFITDDHDPWGVVSRMTEPLVPGSYLALSHSTLEGPPADLVADIQERYKSASAPSVFRDRAAITRFFDGFELVDPGFPTMVMATSSCRFVGQDVLRTAVGLVADCACRGGAGR